MKTSKKYVAVLATLIMGTSCGRFLELSPQTARNTLDFFNSHADFNTALAANYAALKLAGTYNSSLIWMGEVASDNTDYGKQRQSQLVFQFQFIDLAYTSLNSIIYAAWRDHYIGISRANTILDRLPKVEMAQQMRDQYEGEAKFLRALFYFNLVRLFGEVPLVTKEITSPDEGDRFPQSSESAIYAQVIGDLTDAAKKLPDSYTSSNVGRATAGAAKSLLGKVYVTQKQWSLAGQTLKEVIDAGQYRLLSSYAAVFDYNTPINDEVIFNVQYKSGNTGQGSDFWQDFAPDLVTTPVLGPNGGSGKGINMPTADMENAYEAGDSRKDFSMQNHYLNAAEQRIDVRYVTKFKQYGALPGDSDVDFPVLRYADVLLMYAESLIEQGRVAEGLQYANEVRFRADLNGVTTADQGEARQLVAQERRVELAFESHRWFDLVRTGTYLETMVSKGYDAQPFHVHYLIPQRELDLNPLLIQNDGY